MAPPNSLNGTAEVGPTSELMTETAETMIWQSVLQELEKWKAKWLLFTKKRKPIQAKLNLQWKECQNSQILALKEIIKRGRSWNVIIPMTKKKEHLKRG